MLQQTNPASPFVIPENQQMNFQELFSSLSVMFYVENFVPEYCLEYISPAFESLGYTVYEIYADPKILDRVMHPDDLLMMKEANKPIYEGEKLESDYEYRVYTKSGEMRWWKDCGRPIFNERGERIKWFGIITDITDRKLAEEQLLRSKGELSTSYKTTEAMLESIGDMLFVIDDDGIIERINDSAREMLGFAEEELVGKHVRELTQTESFLTDEEFEKMLAERRLLAVEKDFVCRDGSSMRVSISVALRKDRRIGSVIVAKDIREKIEYLHNLKKYAARLEQSNRELEEFAYVASHDLQEPLRKIQAFGDRLVKKFAENIPDEGKDYVQRMKSAADRMQRLINDLLTFSRVSTKCQPFQPVDVKKIAADVISDLEVRIEETRAEIEIGELPVIDADPSQMRQLLQNLVSNALKFQREGVAPRVRIGSGFSNAGEAHLQLNEKLNPTNGANNNVCQITVSDNGIGFDEKYLDKIFTVFQRLHGRSSYEGSGIGLSVCRKIVERHGGEITARSQPDQGATFLITLPLKQMREEIRK